MLQRGCNTNGLSLETTHDLTHLGAINHLGDPGSAVLHAKRRFHLAVAALGKLSPFSVAFHGWKEVPRKDVEPEEIYIPDFPYLEYSKSWYALRMSKWFLWWFIVSCNLLTLFETKNTCYCCPQNPPPCLQLIPMTLDSTWRFWKNLQPGDLTNPQYSSTLRGDLFVFQVTRTQKSPRHRGDPSPSQRFYWCPGRMQSGPQGVWSS